MVRFLIIYEKLFISLDGANVPHLIHLGRNKEHSEFLIRTGRLCGIYFIKLWKNHLIQHGDLVLRILKIIHIAEIRGWISFDYLKL